MLRKDPISDESIMSYSNMDVYLTSPPSNVNVMPSQKSMNQIVNIPTPNCNLYLGNKQLENMRAKQCSMRQIIPDQAYINNGLACNRQILNSNPLLASNSDDTLINQLYQIAEFYNPIDKLTLSVNNGQLVGPFVLTSNQLITEVEFNLTEVSLNEIIKRDDLDIVLWSRPNRESPLNLLKWPQIGISVNDTLLSLEMKIFKSIPIHLPQYIKNLCVVGKNVVKFEIFDLTKFNMNAFMFNIYMVHRPTIVHAKQLALNNALVSDELTVRILRENCISMNRQYLHISTICPITKKRIEIPARLKCCTHLQPFDLVAFLKMQALLMVTMCPCCSKSMSFNFNGMQQNIVIDKILNSIFEKIPVGYDMVRLNGNLTFSPVPNTIYSGIEFNQNVDHTNNVMIPGRHVLPHVPEIHPNLMMHQSQPLPPNYRPSDPSLNFQIINGNQYRMINTSLNSMSMDSRTMLDLHPSEDQSIEPGMKYPHQTPPLVYNNEKPLVKKPVKRKLPRKSTPKTKIDTNPNITQCTNQPSNGAITPPSTRTSSVASTSSPDSLNVPHLNLKRPPSIDLLSSTVLPDCHLSTGDDTLMFSTTSVSQMNNQSFSNTTQLHQQHQPYYPHVNQLPPESKSMPNWSNSEHLNMQQHHQQFHQQMQQQMQQQQIQQQQIQQQQIQRQQIQQQQIQQQQIQQHQIQHQQLQQPIPPQQIPSQQIQQHLPQPQLLKQPDQQQQFNLGITSSTQQFYSNQNSNNLSSYSVKQDTVYYPGSVKPEISNNPPSVKQDFTVYPTSVKDESQDYPHQSTSDTTNNFFTHQNLSNSSCSSSIGSFVDSILSKYEPVPEVEECPWLEGFNLINLQESVNLSDIEDFS